ncbi:arginase family protein, partial [Akkermansiaceae bacterium]|nr:arginase family protein [Akkermansiaceae bacterium]
SITPGPVKAAFERHPELAVIQFDAHADLREEWNGSRNSHACAMRRILDFLPAERLLQVGIRSGTREEFQEMRGANRLIAPTAAALTEALERVKGRPIYVTFDIDFFDPSCVPGTGTPEPGGIDWATCESLLEVLTDSNIVALDIMELAPTLDSSEVSSVVAAKLLREFLLLIG